MNDEPTSPRVPKDWKEEQKSNVEWIIIINIQINKVFII